MALSAESRLRVAEYIRTKVAAGFDSPQEITESAIEVFSDEGAADDLEAFVPADVRAAIEEHLRAELEWPETTDCDRLDAAFAELEQRGVVARQDFSCCGTCGAAEIEDEMNGDAVRGYTFFHMQDTDAAAEGEGLYLSYGAAEEGEKAALSIGHEIVAVLRRHGLSVVWDGSWQKRISVPLRWQRRYRK